MEKFLNVKGTAGKTYAGSQLVSCNGIKTIATTTATDCEIQYLDGTTTTVKTASSVDFDVQIALQDAVVAALQTSWARPVYDVELPKAVVSIINE